MLQKFAKLKASSEGIDRIIYMLIRVMLQTDVHEAERELATAKELLSLQNPREVLDSRKYRLILQNLCCMVEYMGYHKNFKLHFFSTLKILLKCISDTKSAWKARYLSLFGSSYLKWAAVHDNHVNIIQVRNITNSLLEDLGKLNLFNLPQVRFLHDGRLSFETATYLYNKGGSAEDYKKTLEDVIENFSKSFRGSKPPFYYCLIGDCYLERHRLTKSIDIAKLCKTKGAEAYSNALDRSSDTFSKENELTCLKLPGSGRSKFNHMRKKFLKKGKKDIFF